MIGKTVLLTGGTGFLGSHLLEELCNKGYTVVLLKRSFSDISKISGSLDNIKYYDIDKLYSLEDIFKNEKIDIIIHTATDYGRRTGNFHEVIESNLLFPVTLLELGIRYGLQSFINTDTFRDENLELPTGLSYYSYSKRDFIKYARKLIDTTSVKLINIRLEHLYGPKDSETKFIPYIITSLLKNVESVDLTNGEQKKDFIYIKDAVHAYMYVLDNLSKIHTSFDEFDLGCGDTLSIKNLILKINAIVKSTTHLNFGKLNYRKGEPMESKGDITKLNAFGWQPTYTIDDGILETINYFKSLNVL